jgi:hypothetical protein
MDKPPPSFLDILFPRGVTDWTKFSSGSVNVYFHEMAAFAYAWAPLERRWAAGDFSRMQPTLANPYRIGQMVTFKMMSAAGAKEKELQGITSISSLAHLQRVEDYTRSASLAAGACKSFLYTAMRVAHRRVVILQERRSASSRRRHMARRLPQMIQVPR